MNISNFKNTLIISKIMFLLILVELIITLIFFDNYDISYNQRIIIHHINLISVFFAILIMMFLCKNVIKIKTDFNLMKHYFNSVPFAFFAKNLSGKYIFCNSFYKNYIGKSDSEIFGKHAKEVFGNNTNITSEDINKIIKGDLKIAAGIKSTLELINITEHKTSKTNEFYVIKFPLKDENGSIYGILGFGFIKENFEKLITENQFKELKEVNEFRKKLKETRNLKNLNS